MIANIEDFLNRGQVYTMSLLEGGIFGDVVGQGIDSATSALQTVSGVSGLKVSQSFLSIYTFDITFTYTGDGADTVAAMYQNFADALGHWGYTWDYVTTVTGTQSGSAGGDATQTIKDAITSVTPSTGSLWAIAVIGLLAVFLLSGGAAATRRLVPA